MNKKYVRWLFDELPVLVDKGILSEENAGKILEYYGGEKTVTKQQVALTIFGIIGGVLIGTGIILLFAHNWEQLSRGTRTFLSLLPLIIGQLLVIWVLWSQKKSTGWREGSSTFLMLAIGSSIALISQTYNIPGDFGNFLLMWMLLSIPLVYILNASLPAVLYFIGITAWSGYTKANQSNPALFWPLAALIIPHFWQLAKNNLYSPQLSFLSWTVAISLCIATGITFADSFLGYWFIVYGCLFSVMFLAGNLWFTEAPTIWQKPFFIVGGAGITILSLLLTYSDMWHNINVKFFPIPHIFSGVSTFVEFIMTIVFLITPIILAIITFRRQQTNKLIFGLIFILAIAAYLLYGLTESPILPIIIFNTYLFVLALSTIIYGIRSSSLSTTNTGMVILALLIIFRFFDSEVGFVIRGIVFIALGIGFLVTNVLMLRRKGGIQK